MKERYPKEYEEFINFNGTNIEKKQKLEDISLKLTEEYKAEKATVRKMVEEYNKTKDKKISEQIKAKIAAKFDIKIEIAQRGILRQEEEIKKLQDNIVKSPKSAKWAEKKIKELQEKVTKAQADIQSRIAKKDETINTNFEEICTQFHWLM